MQHIYSFFKGLRQKLLPEVIVETEEANTQLQFPKNFRTRLVSLIKKKHVYRGGTLLILSTIFGNFLNFLFNIILGRIQNLEDFAVLGLIASFGYITSIPTTALSTTVNYRAGFLDTKFGQHASHLFWKYIRKNSLIIGVLSALIWIMLSPLMKEYFKLSEALPIILFAGVWFASFMSAADRGYLSGKLLFGSMAFVLLVEPIVKVLMLYGFVQTNNVEYAYTSLIIPYMLTVLVSWHIAKKQKNKILSEKKESKEIYNFSKKFYLGSLLSGLSMMTFLSLDILLAKHYLPPEEAGRYALISLIGKIIFFLGELSSQFVLPLVSRNEGLNKNSNKTLYAILLATFALTGIGTILFGFLGYITLPLIFGAKSIPIIQYLIPFSFAMMGFTLSRVIIIYYLTKKNYIFPFIGFLLGILQFILISFNHEHVGSIVYAMLTVGITSFIMVMAFHVFLTYIKSAKNIMINISKLISYEK